MFVKSELVEEAIYNLCIRANTVLDKDVYEKLKSPLIKENAHLAYENKRPLCQDTGIVVVFLEIGKNVHIDGKIPKDAINNAVKNCYINEVYRKSTVNDAIFDRSNPGTNTPAIIYTDIVDGNEISLTLGVKGGGAENMSRVKMFNPTSSKEEIADFIVQTVEIAGKCACPPVFCGVGIGGTIDWACVNAKKALFIKKEKNDFEKEILSKNINIFDINIISGPCHIASLPVCVNLNCHSSRHAKAIIKNGEIDYIFEDYKPNKVEIEENIIEIDISEKEKLKNIKKGEKICITGTIYIARDQAHKRLCELIKNHKELPFDLKDSIIFYAGPIDKKGKEVIGPIGPTTSKRMDKYAQLLYEKGVLATIGKGERNIEGLYFEAEGGVSNVLQKSIKSSEIIAFNDLGAEAIRKIYVEKFPITRA